MRSSIVSLAISDLWIAGIGACEMKSDDGVMQCDRVTQQSQSLTQGNRRYWIALPFICLLFGSFVIVASYEECTCRYIYKAKHGG